MRLECIRNACVCEEQCARPSVQKIIVPESFNFDHTISDAVLNDSIAASHISIIGGHIYGEGFKGFLWSLYQSIIAGGHIFRGGLTSYPMAISKGKEVWMTEHLNTDTSWSAVLGTAKEIHELHECRHERLYLVVYRKILRADS